MAEEHWAIEHQGGCHGNMRQFTFFVNETMARIGFQRCTDPACRIVKAHVTIIKEVERRGK